MVSASGYERIVRKMVTMKGRKRKKLRSKASAYRKRLIARNRWHPADGIRQPRYNKLRGKMPKKYKKLLDWVAKHPQGRKALKRYKQFWGLPVPTNIRLIETPGPKNRIQFVVGMGKSPRVILEVGGKKKQIAGNRLAAVDASGRRIMILTGRDSKASKQKLRLAGRAPETHYVPTGAMEKAGTFKRGKYWVHKHTDEGGKPPKVYVDQAGNYVYGPGTYRVTKWIRR